MYYLNSDYDSIIDVAKKNIINKKAGWNTYYWFAIALQKKGNFTLSGGSEENNHPFKGQRPEEDGHTTGAGLQVYSERAA